MDKIKRFLFKNSNTKQTVVKNTFWVAGSTIVMKVLRAAIIIYVARILGTEGYGVFTYAMSIAAIFAVLSDMGLTSILTRELSSNTVNEKQYLASSILVKIGFLLITILGIVLIGPFISRFPQSSSLLSIIALSLSFESARSFLYAITRSQNKMQIEAGLGIMSELLCTLLVIVVFFKNPTPHALALAYMIGNGIGLIAVIFTLRSYLLNTIRYVQKSLILPIIKASLPFTIMGVFGVLMTNIDSVIIGLYNNESTLGLYGAAQRPISLLYILPGFITASLFPFISKYAAEQKEGRIASVLEKSILLSLAIALPIAAGGIIVAQPFINAAFGYNYIGATLTFQILLLSILFSFPGSMVSDVMLAEKKQKILVYSSILGAGTNVLLDFLLIPSFGIAGSAIATFFAQVVANGIFFIAIGRYNPLGIFAKSWKLILATLIMAIATYLFTTASIPLLVIVPFAAAIYIASLVLLRERLVTDIKTSLKS